MHGRRQKRFLFSAIVGQEKLKKGLLANIVNPRIGGLLISGAKGTGKSTVVRAVEGILPEYTAVNECPFNCRPHDAKNLCTLCLQREHIKAVTRQMRIVNLPLSTTEDRLVGSIDLEALLQKGEKRVVPGILGQANQNILYVDEVNLLPDHLVDDILDAAASHLNTIERESISINHPADFVLVGTMNPEEGDLRPQILDRFSLCIKVETVRDPAARVDIIKNNLLFENDPDGFCDKFSAGDEEIKSAVLTARQELSNVCIDEENVRAVAETCAALKVDGQRPDIVIVKASMALAALAGRNEASKEDIRLAAELTLIHRTRDGGLLEPPSADEIEKAFAKVLGDARPGGKKIRFDRDQGEVARERVEVILGSPVVKKNRQRS
jgi:Mg-chelatase subunit ChlI